MTFLHGATTGNWFARKGIPKNVREANKRAYWVAQSSGSATGQACPQGLRRRECGIGTRRSRAAHRGLEVAFDEEAKAVQEVAKASGKVIDATREAGGFVAKFIGEPLSTAAQIVNDKLKYIRWERQHRLILRADEFLKQIGLDKPDRAIPLNVAVPLLEAAAIEEDDDLQDVWAIMLVNAANADAKVEIRRMFVSILQDMSSLDVRCLEKIAHVFPTLEGEDPSVYTAQLPNVTTFEFEGDYPPEPENEVALAIRNLIRLGCIEGTMTLGGFSLRGVTPTELGIALVRACTLQPRK